ncbi:copper chaperone PCu(A)C [Bradyrhizobium sp.]|uniref:copper chaperone PCu(A)C n=1 Tax=Bradyrhizobium sp. TaxID=376 RepID=UPI003C78A805
MVGIGMGIANVAVAGSENLHISKAWVPATDGTGVDVPLLMTVKNDAAEPDALIRVRCPFANFAEKHIVDRGEGAPAMRAIPSIPIPASTTTELKPNGHHVMLLQTRQKLSDGETLTCAVVFQKAGSLETEVRVIPSP